MGYRASEQVLIWGDCIIDKSYVKVKLLLLKCRSDPMKILLWK